MFETRAFQIGLHRDSKFHLIELESTRRHWWTWKCLLSSVLLPIFVVRLPHLLCAL